MADDQEQSVADEQEQTKPRSGFFPKLLLWVLVIAFGYLYLGSLDRNKDDGDSPATAQKAPAPAAESAAGSAVPATSASAAAGSGSGAAWPARPQPVASSGTAAQPAADDAGRAERDVSKTEAEAFAQALMDKQGEAQAPEEGKLGPQPEPPDQPTAGGAAPGAVQAPTLPLPPPRAQPDAGTGTAPAAAAKPAGAEPASGETAAEAGQSADVEAASRQLSPRERLYQRARIAAQYRELRRHAIEDAHRRFFYGRPMPGAYPVPGYFGGPGYPMPGYPAPPWAPRDQGSE
jgi:hypothetical protein